MCVAEWGPEVTGIGSLADCVQPIDIIERGGAFCGAWVMRSEQEKPFQQNLDLQMLGQE
jgi:thiamine biosynthesis protein ThiC